MIFLIDFINYSDIFYPDLNTKYFIYNGSSKRSNNLMMTCMTYGSNLYSQSMTQSNNVWVIYGMMNASRWTVNDNYDSREFSMISRLNLMIRIDDSNETAKWKSMSKSWDENHRARRFFFSAIQIIYMKWRNFDKNHNHSYLSDCKKAQNSMRKSIPTALNFCLCSMWWGIANLS